ncbi:hypothetical protein DXG01_011666 [Tephrocybe rancida]|nr:hypothetical protein DXG01_011666 [Tephrocybe rancida]
MSCTPTVSDEEAFWLVNAWIGMVAFDILIFRTAMYKLWRLAQGGNRSLFYILLRDGAIYCGIIMIVVLANIVMFHLLRVGLPNFILEAKGLITSQADL